MSKDKAQDKQLQPGIDAAASKAALAPEFDEIDRALLALGSRPMRVAYIYCPLPEEESAADALETLVTDPEAQGHALAAREIKALRALGHEVIALAVSYRNLDLLERLEADFVFNGCEGNGLDGDPGVEVVLALEKRLLPFSGAGSGPYALTADKAEMKTALAAAGVPVPAGTVLGHAEQPLPHGLSFPLFVKPRYGFGSIGIDANSRVEDAEACRAAVARVLNLTGADAIVEQFAPGREITVGVIGGGTQTVVLPPLEVTFGRAYAGLPDVRMEATKIDPDSPLYWGFQTHCPAPLTEAEQQRVMQTALAAYRAVGADGFGRVDLRLAPDGTPYVLEVNSNCSLEEDADEHDCGMLPLMGRALGWSYPELLARIIGAGLRRPLKRYRAPKMTLRREDERISAHALLNLRKGVRVSPAGAILKAAYAPSCAGETLVSACGCDLHVEPHLRFLAHADAPSLAIEGQGGSLWLVTTRAVKAGERLTFNREAGLEINLLDELPGLQMTRLQSRARRLRSQGK